MAWLRLVLESAHLDPSHKALYRRTWNEQSRSMNSSDINLGYTCSLLQNSHATATHMKKKMYWIVMCLPIDLGDVYASMGLQLCNFLNLSKFCDLVKLYSSWEVSGYVWQCWNRVSWQFYFDQALHNFLHLRNFIALAFGRLWCGWDLSCKISVVSVIGKTYLCVFSFLREDFQEEK